MSKKRRMAPRDCGTANAVATAASAIAAASGQRRRRRARTGRSCGVAGHSIGSARSSRSRSTRLLQPVERARGARLDGAARDVERRGGLLLGEIEQVAAGEHFARVGGELLERGQQLLPLRGVERGILGGGGRLPRERRRSQSELLAPAGGAAAVASLVRGDLE